MTPSGDIYCQSQKLHILLIALLIQTTLVNVAALGLSES
jgi:hypothetical protein